jgi:hypothetical protein
MVHLTDITSFYNETNLGTSLLTDEMVVNGCGE